MKTLLKELTEYFSPSAREDEILALIKEKSKPFANAVFDSFGNLILHKKGKGERIMFTAPVDEMGFFITHIENNGTLRFFSETDALPQNILYNPLIIEGKIKGVALTDKSDVLKINFSDMYVDIGAKDKADAEKNVRIGDSFVLKGKLLDLGDRLYASSLSTKSLAAVLIKALEFAKDSENDLYFAFLKQSKTGNNGVKCTIDKIKPSIVYCLEGHLQSGTFNTGNGIGIKIKDAGYIIPGKIKDEINKKLRKIKIKSQYIVTDTVKSAPSAVQKADGNILCGAVCIPVSNINTFSEGVNINDIKDCVKLITELQK